MKFEGPTASALTLARHIQSRYVVSKAGTIVSESELASWIEEANSRTGDERLERLAMTVVFGTGDDAYEQATGILHAKMTVAELVKLDDQIHAELNQEGGEAPCPSLTTGSRSAAPKSDPSGAATSEDFGGEDYPALTSEEKERVRRLRRPLPPETGTPSDTPLCDAEYAGYSPLTNDPFGYQAVRLSFARKIEREKDAEIARLKGDVDFFRSIRDATAADLAAARAEVEATKAKAKETAKDFETAFRVVREENDQLRAEVASISGERDLAAARAEVEKKSLEYTRLLLDHDGLRAQLAEAQEQRDAAKLLVIATEGMMGHAVPVGLALPKAKENVIAKFIAKERDQLATALNDYATVAWWCSNNNAKLQHGDLDKPHTFSIVILGPDGHCFHDATLLGVLEQAKAWPKKRSTTERNIQ